MIMFGPPLSAKSTWIAPATYSLHQPSVSPVTPDHVALKHAGAQTRSPASSGDLRSSRSEGPAAIASDVFETLL